jgi:CheY-like chemotaxis protein
LNLRASRQSKCKWSAIATGSDTLQPSGHISEYTTDPTQHKLGHFSSKRFWFSVPYGLTAPQADASVKASGSAGITDTQPPQDSFASPIMDAGVTSALSPSASSDFSSPSSATSSQQSPSALTPPVHSIAAALKAADPQPGANSGASISARSAALQIPFNKHVLFVDDEAIIGKLAARFLQKLGCTYTILSDGDQVVPTLQRSEQKYDIILMDIVMHRMNGEDACRAVRDFDPTIPILAATANTSAQDLLRYTACGFKGCLPKPYTMADMQHALQKYCIDLRL